MGPPPNRVLLALIYARRDQSFYFVRNTFMISMAVMIGGLMVKLVSWRPAKVAWALYPLLVTFVVVATASHYLTDVFPGALTAGVSAALAHRLSGRARPEVRAFRRAAA
jgi:ABC-type Co2+ transport system permease subunit